MMARPICVPTERASELEAFIQRKYSETRDFVTSHPYAGTAAEHDHE